MGVDQHRAICYDDEGRFDCCCELRAAMEQVREGRWVWEEYPLPEDFGPDDWREVEEHIKEESK